MATVLGAVIVGLLALSGIVIGAHYASLRLLAQLDEQRRWEDERREEDARRLQLQLDAESDRLQRQLDADNERLQRQLDHDRHMRDRESLRVLLDEGLRIAFDASDLATDFESFLEETPPRDPKGRLVLSERKLAMNERLHHFWQRLAIRFRPGDDLTRAFSKFDETYTKLTDAVRSALDGEADEDDDLVALEDKMLDAQIQFLKTCHEYVPMQVGQD